MSLAVLQPLIPDSPLARRDARWKLAAGLVLLLANAALATPGALAALLALAVLLTQLARVPASMFVTRVGLLLLTAWPLALAPLLFPSPTAWAEAIALTLRILVAGTLALALMRSTPLARLAAAARELGVPALLTEVAQLAVRYAALFLAEMRRARVALSTRGFRPRTNLHTYRTLGYGVAGLVVRGEARANRVAAAMRCRGRRGPVPPLDPFRIAPADVVGFACVVAVALLLVACDRGLTPW